MDGTEKQGDALPKGGQPSPTSQNPSTPSTTFTQDQVDTLIKERHSKLDKKIAELEKQVKAGESTKTELAAVRTQLAQMQANQEAAERDKFKDDPDKLNAFEMRREAIKAREEAGRLRQEAEDLQKQHEVEIAEARETKRDVEIWEIAQEHGLDPMTLKEDIKAVEDDTGKSLSGEAIKYLAGRMGKKSSEPLVSGKPDSGATSGGSGELTPEMVAKMSSEERWKRRAEIAKLPLPY